MTLPPYIARKWPIPTRITQAELDALCEEHHPYGSGSGAAAQLWGCRGGGGRTLAAWAWKPPPPGAAKAICPEQPAAVLALSRMVAIPKVERAWHISRPLKWLMRHGIDRGRWPVLVTYSDVSVGHTGHVYLCSGWTRGPTMTRTVAVNERGERASVYACGRKSSAVVTGTAELTRWEHWACERGDVNDWMRHHGWVRRPVPGKTWASGSQVHKWVRP